MGIKKDEPALLALKSPGAERNLACTIPACELGKDHLPPGVPPEQLSLRPVGLRTETPNPFPAHLGKK